MSEGSSYALPSASFFEAADAAADLEAEGMDKPALNEPKTRLWVRMGTELEAAGWPRHAIAVKIAREIEQRLHKRTGVKATVRTAHYYRVMAEHRWVDPERQAAGKGRKTGGRSSPEGAPKKPYIDLGRGAEDVAPDSTVQQQATGRQKARALNEELAGALRDLADSLRWAAKTIENPKWDGAESLRSSHPTEYDEAVKTCRATSTILEEEGSKRLRVPKSAYHLFRRLAGRGELSALRVSELFAQRRLELDKEAGDRIGKAIVAQHRAGHASEPPPLLDPRGRDAALMLGWAGDQCGACGSWRVEQQAAPIGRPDRRCTSCGGEAFAVHPVVCPKCRGLVYGPAVQRGSIVGRMAAACSACGHKIPLDAKSKEMLAPEAK